MKTANKNQDKMNWTRQDRILEEAFKDATWVEHTNLKHSLCVVVPSIVEAHPMDRNRVALRGMLKLKERIKDWSLGYPAKVEATSVEKLPVGTNHTVYVVEMEVKRVEPEPVTPEQEWKAARPVPLQRAIEAACAAHRYEDAAFLSKLDEMTRPKPTAQTC